MLRHTQIGTKAATSITAMPSAKRRACGTAQGHMLPPAAEYSISRPKPAAATISTISGQFR